VLELSQEVSSLLGAGSVLLNGNPITNERKIQTTVLADDGQTVILGGLMEDSLNNSQQKVPLLGDIPGLGRLFRSSSNAVTKTHLLVFLRASIMRENREMSEATAAKYRTIRDEQIANSPNVPTIPVLPHTPAIPALSQVPFSFAQQHGVLLDCSQQPPLVLHRLPLTNVVLAELGRVLQGRYRLQAISAAEFQQQLKLAFATDNSVAGQVAADLGADTNLARLADDIDPASDLMEGEESAPVIRLINALIAQALRERASDIHIETYEDCVTVRFRTDGVLTEVLSPKRLLAPLLVSRIKVMAKLDIAEKRLPQDGRISVKLAGHALDIRVSTLPAAHGERVVLRLLDKQNGQLGVHQLRMPAAVLQSYQQALRHPHGIILVTGPTGSGKTTTLYAGLQQLNDGQKNILTIEDPVEYTLPGVGQTQVNTKVGLSFANGLRSILRQDPDVVMLGEIRDVETARIAVQASLTGHLVLSTLHTNTAVGAVTRLHDMGIEPFLLASSLVAVLSQRLVRQLCPHCKQAYSADAEECRALAVTGALTLYRAGGCAQCRHTGYQHRLGIFEAIQVDDELRRLIHAGAGEAALTAAARQQSQSLSQAGAQLVLAGETTLAEVLRVTTG
jgi:general secretion pathway protein E